MGIFRLPRVWLLICISSISMSGAVDRDNISTDIHSSIQDLLQWYVSPAKIFRDKLVIAINIRLEEMSSTLTILKTLLPLIKHVQPRNLGIDFRSKIGQLGSSLSRVYSALGHNAPDIVSAKTAHELTELIGKNITTTFNDNFEKSSGIFYQQGKLLRKINEHPLWFPYWATTWVSKQPSRLIKSVRG